MSDEPYKGCTCGWAVTARAEIERLRSQIDELRRWKALDKPLTAAMGIANTEIERLCTDNAKLLDLVIVAQPEMERLETCEAIADDGYGSRLQTLRQWKINARRALEEEEIRSII